MHSETVNYWYQEPWVWFILILLTVAIIAASAMSIVAIQHTPAEIGSRWYQEGALAKRERQQDSLIRSLHLSATLDIAQTGKVLLTMTHDKADAQTEDLKEINVNVLKLYIEHPTDPAQDQVVTLHRGANGQYEGNLQARLSGKRRLLISPESDLWYVTSHGYFPVASITFSPDMS
tara:strand:- start:910 stop:1437 length:528 start_codon:yes stop_codon:yes gene_type:complete